MTITRNFAYLLFPTALLLIPGRLKLFHRSPIDVRTVGVD